MYLKKKHFLLFRSTILYLFSIIAIFGIVSNAKENITTTKQNDCYPIDWSVPWTKVGQVWYARIKSSGTWWNHEERCKKLDPAGRSGMATIRSYFEQKHLEETTKCCWFWTGGLRIAQTRWLWYGGKNRKVTLTPINTFHWNSNEPTDNLHEDCMILSNGKWEAFSCSNNGGFGLCELRCDDS